MNQDSSFDLGYYLRMVWRRRGVIILATVTVLCVSTVGIQFIPPEFESTATLRMEERRRLSSELEKVIGGGGGGGGGYRADEARLDEMAARITSRPFLERVARLLKMNEDPRVLETARKALRSYPDATVDELAIRHVVNQLRKKIDFANTGMGNYQIIVADSDPKHAQLLAKWIAELFIGLLAPEFARRTPYRARIRRGAGADLRRTPAPLRTRARAVPAGSHPDRFCPGIRP